jgi:DMSO reductase anchor subunit
MASADIRTKVVNLKLLPTIKLIRVNLNITAIICNKHTLRTIQTVAAESQELVYATAGGL